MINSTERSDILVFNCFSDTWSSYKNLCCGIKGDYTYSLEVIYRLTSLHLIATAYSLYFALGSY